MYGIMDLCGFDKDAFSIRQAQWVHDRPVLRLMPHWTWPGREGQGVKVMACTNLDEVELVLNGKSQGRQKADRYEMNTWTVTYAPGRLEAIGYHVGKPVAKARVETAGPAVALKITADRDTLAGDGLDAVPFRVETVDSHGRHVPISQNTVSFAITGGEIIGLGNGDPNCLEAEKGKLRSLFNGLAQVITQAHVQASGDLILTASAQGLRPATARVRLAASPPPARQAVTTSFQVLDYWYCAPEADTREGALANMQIDMTLWDDFGPRWLHDAQPVDGYTLCSAHYTPFARVQKEGGVIDFPSLTGTVEIYDGDHLLATKTDPAEAFLSVDLPPGQGARRINLLFTTPAGKPFAFQKMVVVRQKETIT